MYYRIYDDHIEEAPHICEGYEIWCIDPVQLIELFDTRVEAEDAMKKYLDGGVISDDYFGLSFDPLDFIIVDRGEDRMNYDFYKKEEYRIRGWIELDSDK